MDDSRVLASVNGMNITEDDVTEEIYAMGQSGAQFNSPEGRAMVLEQLIAKKLLLASAKHDLLEFDPEFKKQLAIVKDELLAKTAISKAISGVRITDEEVRKFYDENPDQFASGETVSASHILVDTEDKANEVKAEIASGAISFEDAARKYSSCPSKENGGNLGEFTHGQMVQEFDAAAFALEVGVVSEPVKTQFGYHLIKVNSKGESKTYAFDEIKDQLREQLLGEKRKKAYTSKINQLRIQFPVDRF